MSLIPATTSCIEGPSERRYSQRNGWQTIRKFKGTQVGVEAQEAILIAAGYDTASRGGPSWELEATIPMPEEGQPAEQPVNTWELNANPVEKDLLQADIAAVNNLDPADRKKLRDHFDGKIDAETYDNSNDDYWTNPTWGEPDALMQLWLAGTKSVIVYQPILTHALTVSRYYQIPASLSGVGEIWTSAQLVAAETTMPADLAANLPTSSYVSKSGITNGFLWGWMKVYPHITAAAFSKRQLNQEFQWGLWSTVLYPIQT